MTEQEKAQDFNRLLREGFNPVLTCRLIVLRERYLKDWPDKV